MRMDAYRACVECSDTLCIGNAVLLPLLRALSEARTVFEYMMGREVSNARVEWSNDRKMVVVVMRWPKLISDTVVGLYCYRPDATLFPRDFTRVANRLRRFVELVAGFSSHRFLAVVACNPSTGAERMRVVNGVWLKSPEKAVSDLGKWFWKRVEGLLKRLGGRVVRGMLVCNAYAWALITAMCSNSRACVEIKTEVMMIASGKKVASAEYLLDLFRRYCVEGEELRRE